GRGAGPPDPPGAGRPGPLGEVRHAPADVDRLPLRDRRRRGAPGGPRGRAAGASRRVRPDGDPRPRVGLALPLSGRRGAARGHRQRAARPAPGHDPRAARRTHGEFSALRRTAPRIGAAAPRPPGRGVRSQESGVRRTTSLLTPVCCLLTPRLGAAGGELVLLPLRLQLAQLAIDLALRLEGGELLVEGVDAQVGVGLGSRLLLLDAPLHPLELAQAADALDAAERAVHLLLRLRRAASGDQQLLLRLGLLNLALKLPQAILEHLDLSALRLRLLLQAGRRLGVHVVPLKRLLGEIVLASVDGELSLALPILGRALRLLVARLEPLLVGDGRGDL